MGLLEVKLTTGPPTLRTRARTQGPSTLSLPAGSSHPPAAASTPVRVLCPPPSPAPRWPFAPRPPPPAGAEKAAGHQLAHLPRCEDGKDCSGVPTGQNRDLKSIQPPAKTKTAPPHYAVLRAPFCSESPVTARCPVLPQGPLPRQTPTRVHRAVLGRSSAITTVPMAWRPPHRQHTPSTRPQLLRNLPAS